MDPKFFRKYSDLISEAPATPPYNPMADADAKLTNTLSGIETEIGNRMSQFPPEQPIPASADAQFTDLYQAKRDAYKQHLDTKVDTLGMIKEPTKLGAVWRGMQQGQPGGWDQIKHTVKSPAGTPPVKGGQLKSYYDNQAAQQATTAPTNPPVQEEGEDELQKLKEFLNKKF